MFWFDFLLHITELKEFYFGSLESFAQIHIHTDKIFHCLFNCFCKRKAERMAGGK